MGQDQRKPCPLPGLTVNFNAAIHCRDNSIDDG